MANEKANGIYSLDLSKEYFSSSIFYAADEQLIIEDLNLSVPASADGSWRTWKFRVLEGKIFYKSSGESIGNFINLTMRNPPGHGDLLNPSVKVSVVKESVILDVGRAIISPVPSD